MPQPSIQPVRRPQRVTVILTALGVDSEPDYSTLALALLRLTATELALLNEKVQAIKEAPRGL